LRRQVVAIGVTLAVAALNLIALALLVVTPWLKHRLGLDAHATELVFVRWVGAGFLVMLVWSLMYTVLPDERPVQRRIFPGAIVGVLLWLGSSALFGIYLDHFGSYETTYGALGTAIIFLIWLWLSNIALLLGAEINEVLGDVLQQHSRDRSRLRSLHVENSMLPRDHEEAPGVRGAGVGERLS
jgi:membrane protein